MATLFLIVKRFQDAGIEASACALKHRQYVTYLRRAQYYAWFKQVSTCQSYSNGGAKDQSQWRRPSLPVARGVRLNNEQMCMTCERLKPGGLAARVPIWHTPCQAARLKTIQDGLMEVTENLCSNCLRLYSHAYFFDNIMQGMIACFNYVHFSCVFI